MKDELKDLFEGHNDHNEEEIPSGHFDRFADKLDKSNKSFDIKATMKWAAAVILLMGIGYLLALTLVTPSAPNMMVQNPNESISKENNVTQNLDKYFTKKVNMKVAELKNVAVGDTTLINESISELEVLEEEYIELKNKLAELGGNKLIIKAMAKNYRTRLKLLDLLISRLEYNLDKDEPVKAVKEDKHFQ
ncbi:MAG: hypothetical protein ACI8XB_000751 [Patiriisocius sp.]|jgi:hypothetical protein